jgi:membrane-bound lytic murein transglycosylase B
MWELDTHPSRCLLYGVDGDGNGSGEPQYHALGCTANFLKGHGWVRGAGYQPGQPNFSAIQSWKRPLASIRRRSHSLVRRSMGNKTLGCAIVTLNTLDVAEHVVRVEA